MDFWIIFVLIVLATWGLPFLFFKDKERIFTFFLLFILILISGFRYQIGWDYSNYERLFYLSEDDFGGAIEPSFILLCTVLKDFGFSAQMMFFLYSFLTLLFVYFAAKFYTKKPIFFLVLYALAPYLFWNSMGNIRNYLAIAIIFWGSRFLVEKKIYLYLIVVAIAASIHYSAGIFFVLGVFLYREYSLKTHFLLTFICFIFSVSGISFFLADQMFSLLDIKYAIYLISSLSGSLGVENILLSTFFWLISMLLLRKVYQKNQEGRKAIIAVNIVPFSFIAMELFYFSYELERIREYGFPFFIVSLVMVLDMYIVKSFKTIAMSLCVFCFCVLFLAYINVMGNNLDGIRSNSLSAGNINYEFNFNVLED